MSDEIQAEMEQPVIAPEAGAAEAGLLREVVDLWTSQKDHAAVTRRTRDELRELRSRLAERLHHLKALVAQTGRAGQWSSYLRENGIPRATADRYVAKHESTLRTSVEKCLSESISTPSEDDVHRLFQRLLPRLRRVLTTQEAAFHFVSDMVMHLPGIDGDFPETGVEIYKECERASV